MKYKVLTEIIESKRSILCLIGFLALLVACQGNTSSGADSAPANDSTQNHTTKPSIQITEVPPKGAGPDRVERIAGTVSGVNGKECKVIVFAGTDTWYVQPYIEASDTEIKDSNTWQTDTHLGSRYAALLVNNSYKPPSTTGRLPDVGGPILAIVVVDAKP
jgi:hypothetical protein